MRKRLTLSILAVLLLAAAVLAAPQYVASANREPFHRLSCRWAQKISPKNERKGITIRLLNLT